MKYMLLFIRDEGIEEDDATLKANHAAINEWFGEYGPEGKILGGEELQRSSTATTIRWSEGRPLVTDGPFVESKETVAGFAIFEAADLDEAIAAAKKWPPKNQAVEIRPVIIHDDMPHHPA